MSRKVVSTAMLALMGAFLMHGSSYALEASTVTGDRNVNALVNVRLEKFNDVLPEIERMQELTDAINVCLRGGNLYAPGKSGADSNGCVPLQVSM